MTAKRVGKSIKIFLVDGSVGGLRTAEIMNWTGHVIAAQRSDLGELLKRDEVKRTGTYILLGDDQAYIGEADVIGERLRQHNQDQSKGGKDFWTDVFVITSKDANLTKAHARYLEARFIAIALEAGRIPLTNKANPEPPALPEADASDMEYFISQVQIILPVLGVNLLRDAKSMSANSPEASSAISSSPTFTMTVPHGGGLASAQEIDGEFIVLQSSRARGEWVGKASGRRSYIREIREVLLEKGVLVNEGSSLVFVQDYVFSSPSAAAALIAGTDTHNGRQSWKVEGKGISYGAWQEQQIVDEAE
jgi:hypothetical protein